MAVNVPSQPTFPETPTSRAYVHARCGGTTVVDGDDFVGLCNPMFGLLPVQTYCVKCAGVRPLEEFVWADTNETLAAYRQRLRATVVSPAAKLGQKVLRMVCLIGLPMMGLAFGQRHGGPGAILWPAVGVIVGFVLGVVILGVAAATSRRDYRKYR